MTDLSDMTQAEKVAYWTQGYHLWNALLAGRTDVQIFEDEPCLGFWRKGIYERDAKGNERRIGWGDAIAIYMDGGMVARVGSIDVTRKELLKMWTWIVKNPVPEKWYRDVAEDGKPWPDAKTAEIPAANRDVAKSDNEPPELPPVQQHATAINAAIGAALKTVANEEEAAIALGSKNRIAELRLACDKAGKAEYEPMYADYVAVRDPWQKPVKDADAEEKRIAKMLLTFREAERQRIAKEQADAERKQRELDEANARAADRAISRGEPEPPPEVAEVVMPVAAAPISPTYGTRKLREEMKKFAVINDTVAALTYFQADAEIRQRLEKLCTDVIRAGGSVPGCTFREGLL